VLRTFRAVAATTAAALAAAVPIALQAAAPAAAAASGPAPVFSCDHCQFAGGDILNAGRDNVVGSSALDQSPSPASTTLVVTNLINPMARLSQTGVGDYPQNIPQDSPAIFPVQIPSGATYRFGDDDATIAVTQAGVSCQTTGLTSCQVTQGDPADVVIG